MARFETIDAYVASFPEDVQRALRVVREAIRRAVPGTDETMSYGIPTYTWQGRYVVYFAGWKHHVSVYPVPHVEGALERELAPHRAGRGTLRFPLDEPVPVALIERVVALLMDQRRQAS